MIEQKQFPFRDSSQDGGSGSLLGLFFIIIGITLATVAVNHFAEKDASIEK
jgi:uncharacterized membrane protein YidH (DUF202 family)